jgi:DNA repair protein RadD
VQAHLAADAAGSTSCDGATWPAWAAEHVSQVLRKYQLGAIEKLLDGIKRQVLRQLLYSPTGSGKTTIAAALIQLELQLGGAVLFLAHRRELIDQCSARLDDAGVDHGVIQAGHKRDLPGMAVQIASVQTLSARGLRPHATLIVVDEAHHARASTYEKILEKYPGVPVIGLSATPWRLDGRGLGEMFKELVIAAQIHELIEEGHLVGYTGFAYDCPDLHDVAMRGDDYEEKGLEIAMGGRKLVGNVVQQWQLHAGTGPTVVFGCSIDHSKLLAARFMDAGIIAEHIDGEMKPSARAAILRRLEAGITQVVTNVNVLTEGWDLPSLETVVLARPTKSAALYLQMVGRGLRPAPGKKYLRIHDHGGLIMEHGLPDLERDYSLDLDGCISKTSKPSLTICSACWATYIASPAGCPRCAKVEEPSESQTEPPEEILANVTAVPLEELKSKQMPLVLPEAAKDSYYASQKAIGDRRGYRENWAAMRFKAKFGHFPNKKVTA